MQMANDKVQLFEDQPIRTAWVEDEEVNPLVMEENLLVMDFIR